LITLRGENKRGKKEVREEEGDHWESRKRRGGRKKMKKSMSKKGGKRMGFVKRGERWQEANDSVEIK